MKSALNLNRLVYFTTVVETGSFTAAGERLGVAKAVVSHQVAKLEEELRVTLLARTTRKLQTTEQGRWFYDRANALLQDADAAYGEVSQTAVEPTGTLVVTAPIEYGVSTVAPAVATFIRRYPLMTVEVTFDDIIVDLVAANIDVAIRLGWLADSSNQSRRLGTFRQVLACAPLLAKTLPKSLAPADLEKVPWVANRILKTPLQWTFSRGEEAVTINGRAAVTADMSPAAVACVLAGAGVSVFPDFMVEREMGDGRMVPLLTDWSLPEGGIYAVYPAARFRPAKVRLFVELLAEAERLRKRSREKTAG